jgi:deoxyadenosine/deoxycytidine kinase
MAQDTVTAAITTDVRRSEEAIARSRAMIEIYTEFVDEFAETDPAVSRYYLDMMRFERGREAYFLERLPRLVAELQRHAPEPH